MSLDRSEFTEGEERAAIEAIIAERDGLRGQVAVLEGELALSTARYRSADSVIKAANSMRNASVGYIEALKVSLAAAEAENRRLHNELAAEGSTAAAAAVEAVPSIFTDQIFGEGAVGKGTTVTIRRADGTEIEVDAEDALITHGLTAVDYYLLQVKNQELRARLATAEEELAHLRARSERPPGGGPPPEIYLQWYGDDDGYHLIDDEALVAGVTWCDTRVWLRDVRYIRANDTAAPDEEE